MPQETLARRGTEPVAEHATVAAGAPVARTYWSYKVEAFDDIEGSFPLLLGALPGRQGRIVGAHFTDSSPFAGGHRNLIDCLPFLYRPEVSSVPIIQTYGQHPAHGIYRGVKEEILRYLATILEDRRFASAERNAGFLRCVVEKALAGGRTRSKKS